MSLEHRQLISRLSLLIVATLSGLATFACADQVDEGQSSDSSANGGVSATSPTGIGGENQPSNGGSSQTGQGGGSQTSSTGSNTTATGGSSSSTSSGDCPSAEEEKFSFFLASKKVLQDLSGSVDGFGGDLGGISGADSICQQIAERSSSCQKNKVWHAFLSTSSVNAKDRIGSGPWYDRRGRLLAQNLSNLLTERPTGADPAIKDDFPNEDGVPNHAPDGVQVDNHEILTGTGTDGNVYTQSASTGGTGFPMGGGMPGGSTSCGPNNEETWTVEAATCWGWTSKEGKGCPRVGHSWPRQGSGVGWISVWNEGGCLPGGVDNEDVTAGLDGTRRVGSAGGYGGFYCFAVTGG